MAAVALRAAHVGAHGQLAQLLAGGRKLLVGEGQRQAQALALHQLGLGGARAHGHVPGVAPAGGADVEHGEVRGAAAHGLEVGLVGVLVDDDVREDVALVGHVAEAREAHHAGAHELHLRIQRQQRREDVGEAKAAKDRAAHGGEVAELHAHHVTHGVLEHVAGGLVEGLVALELVEGHHRADAEGVLVLLDLVQPTGREVNHGCDAAVLHAQPHAAAQHAVHAPLAHELIGLFDSLGAGVVLELEHCSPSDALTLPAARGHPPREPAGCERASKARPSVRPPTQSESGLLLSLPANVK